MNRFYEEFTKDEIVQRPVAQISWRSIILIMTKCKDHNKALWYVEELPEYLEERLKEIKD